MAGAEETELQELERAVVQIQALKRHLQVCRWLVLGIWF
jgi:hypothetical protein